MAKKKFNRAAKRKIGKGADKQRRKKDARKLKKVGPTKKQQQQSVATNGAFGNHLKTRLVKSKAEKKALKKANKKSGGVQSESAGGILACQQTLHRVHINGAVEGVAMVDTRVYTAGRDGKLKEFEIVPPQNGAGVVTMKPTGKSVELGASCTSLFLSPLSGYLWVGLTNGKVRGYPLKNGQPCELNLAASKDSSYASRIRSIFEFRPQPNIGALLIGSGGGEVTAAVQNFDAATSSINLQRTAEVSLGTPVTSISVASNTVVMGTSAGAYGTPRFGEAAPVRFEFAKNTLDGKKKSVAFDIVAIVEFGDHVIIVNKCGQLRIWDSEGNEKGCVDTGNAVSCCSRVTGLDKQHYLILGASKQLSLYSVPDMKKVSSISSSIGVASLSAPGGTQGVVFVGGHCGSVQMWKVNGQALADL